MAATVCVQPDDEKVTLPDYVELGEHDGCAGRVHRFEPTWMRTFVGGEFQDWDALRRDVGAMPGNGRFVDRDEVITLIERYRRWWTH